MKITKTTPNKIILPEVNDIVKSHLSYVDSSVAFQLHKLKQMHHFKRNDPVKFLARQEELKASKTKTLIFKNEDGSYWTYSGLARMLCQKMNWEFQDLTEKLDADLLDPLPWKKIPFDMRYYQREAVEALLASGGHGAIELPTGSGKSRIIMEILSRVPCKTVIVTPFTNVTKALVKTLEECFGKQNVGQYGDGKRKTDKLFTVANAQSLVKIKEGTKHWDEISQCKQLIFDESHMVPAEYFRGICLNGPASQVNNRFFLSATQTRTDGSDIALHGLIGDVVYTKSYKELAEQGFLKKIKARVFKVATAKSPVKGDPKKETKNNLYENPNVARLVATLAEKAWKIGNRQTVILISEYNQFLLLKNFLNIPYKFAHGAVSKEAKKTLPEEYWKCDIDEMIEEFNDGELPCLIGTTAISTGVDIKPTGCIIYVQGGKSETKTKQGIGRGTRPVGPEDLWVCDVKVVGSPALERHADFRAEIYKELTDETVDIIG